MDFTARTYQHPFGCNYFYLQPAGWLAQFYDPAGPTELATPKADGSDDARAARQDARPANQDRTYLWLCIWCPGDLHCGRDYRGATGDPGLISQRSVHD